MKKQTSSLDVTTTAIAQPSTLSSLVAGKHLLRRSIQMALAGSFLASGMASAVLLDHGVSDPQLVWPQYYRDVNGLAVGVCKSNDPVMCFPPVANPAGFPGNVGSEIFYNLAEFKNLNTGSDFRYRIIVALEAAYMTEKPVHGTEVVFARIRIGFNFNDRAKNGTYVVTHPYGQETFTGLTATTTSNVWGSGTALFFTIDVPGLDPMNFEAALHSAVGPFLQWDDGSGNPVMLDGTNPGEKFLGDPTVVHTFTGSPNNTNFLHIQGPVGSNLDGLGNDFIHVNEATILGQVYTAGIPAKLSVEQAIVTSTSSANAVDVWATAKNAPNLDGTPSATPQLFMTAPGMPSLQMLADGQVSGQYHGHVEFDTTSPAPRLISVTDVNSIPVVTILHGVSDSIFVKQATYDNASGLITLVAHSSDELRAPILTVTGIPGLLPINSRLTAAKCTTAGLVVAAGDMCLQTTLSAAYEVPKSVAISSSELGVSEETYVQVLGKTEAPAGAPAAQSYTAQTVNIGGSTPLPTQIPEGATIITQPANGLVAFEGGQWVFTANAGTAAGSDSFTYVTQNPTTLAVSRLSTVPLTLDFSAKAPTAVADAFTVSTSVARTVKTVNILSNDKPASANTLDNIDPATVTIVTQPTRGTVTVNTTNGLISYTPNAIRVTAADSFTYTVKNSATPAATSNTATVTVQQFAANEVVAVTRSLFVASTAKWTINGATSYFGANLPSTVACWVGTGATPTTLTLIGSALVDNTGGFTIAPAPGVGARAGTNTTLRCGTSNGGIGAAPIQKK